jgi:hypothetical protein
MRVQYSTELFLRPFAYKENSGENAAFDRIIPGNKRIKCLYLLPDSILPKLTSPALNLYSLDS